MRLKNLSMSFGIQELFKNINLYIVETEKIGIVGVNDAGKTTFLKIIMGIISPDNGEEMGFIEYNRRTDLYEKSEQAITDYLYSKISREKVIKGYKLVDTMNKTKNQKALINFKDYYKSSRLNDFEKYSIYLYMIEMPDLLADTKIVYNNKKISFDSFLESEDIYHETFNVINNFYKKVNIKK